MSADLQWLLIKNNSSFVVKKRNINQPFSLEPLNLTSRHNFRQNTLVHKKSVGVIPAKDNKGFVTVLKSSKNSFKPRKNFVKIQTKSGPRRSLSKLHNMIVKAGYRKDLKQSALKRASAILRAQKVRQPKKGRPAKKTD